MYFDKALAILKRDGFIRSTELLKIFHNMNLYTILLCFERNDEDIFKDSTMLNYRENGEKHGYTKVKIYKRLKPIHDRWKKDAKHTIKNGCMGTVGVNL